MEISEKHAKVLSCFNRSCFRETDNKLTKVARENIEKAGLTNKVNIKLGPAAETLKTLSSDVPFDFVFIDADKPNNLTYYLEAKRLTRKGAVIVSVM